MTTTRRQELILDRLRRDGTIYTADLVKAFSVSSETIRKDLDKLEKEGRLERIHGGAVPVRAPSAGSGGAEVSPYLAFDVRNSQNLQQKAAIAAYAASLVEEKQVVALDYGSTSQVLASVLKERFRELTIITNSIRNALVLAENPGFHIMLTGGMLSREEYSLVNEFVPITEFLHIDTFFMTVTGVDTTIGFTDQRLDEVKMQNQLRRASDRTIVLADHSKFGKRSMARLCSLQEVHMIITDGGISEEIGREMRNSGVKLVQV